MALQSKLKGQTNFILGTVASQPTMTSGNRLLTAVLRINHHKNKPGTAVAHAARSLSADSADCGRNQKQIESVALRHEATRSHTVFSRVILRFALNVAS